MSTTPYTPGQPTGYPEPLSGFLAPREFTATERSVDNLSQSISPFFPGSGSPSPAPKPPKPRSPFSERSTEAENSPRTSPRKRGKKVPEAPRKSRPPEAPKQLRAPKAPPELTRGHRIAPAAAASPTVVRASTVARNVFGTPPSPPRVPRIAARGVSTPPQGILKTPPRGAPIPPQAEATTAAGLLSSSDLSLIAPRGNLLESPNRFDSPIGGGGGAGAGAGAPRACLGTPVRRALFAGDASPTKAEGESKAEAETVDRLTQFQGELAIWQATYGTIETSTISAVGRHLSITIKGTPCIVTRLAQGDYYDVYTFTETAKKLDLRGKKLNAGSIVLKVPGKRADKGAPKERYEAYQGEQNATKAYLHYQNIEREYEISFLPTVYHLPAPIPLVTRKEEIEEVLEDWYTSKNLLSCIVMDHIPHPVASDEWKHIRTEEEFQRLSAHSKIALEFFQNVLQASANAGFCLINDMKPDNFKIGADNKIYLIDFAGTSPEGGLADINRAITQCSRENAFIRKWLTKGFTAEQRRTYFSEE